MVFFDPFHIRKRIFYLALVFISLFVFATVFAAYYAFFSRVAIAAPIAAYPRANQDKRVSITFDDGPHPVYTLAIADILERNHVPATFFFLGSNMIRYPSVASDMHNRGFSIGNHTFTHSTNAHSSQRRLAWELNITETIIREQTGVTPTMYRPPYLQDIFDTVLPDTDIPAVAWAQSEGYRTVGATIDSYDWAEESAEGAVKRVKDSLAAKSVHQPYVILLHDDKKWTADALDELIATVRNTGYEIVPLEDLIGFSASAPVTHANYLSVFSAALFYWFMRAYAFAGSAAVYVFTAALAATGIRVAAVLVLFYLSRRKPQQELEPFRGSVSVFIPAYNEEKNIEAALESVMRNTRLPDEIIVINDASCDDTRGAIESVRKRYPDIMRILVFLENKGKASALNAAIRQARGDVFIAIDGDTILHPHAIDYVTRPLADDRVGGVAGKIEVARPHNILTRFQGIEYETAQNMEKTAFNMLGVISVIPGALGAWRRSAVCRVDGYASDTLVEDQDLTISILRLGYRIAYEARAIAYTEAPSSLRSFLKQRFRWTYGTLQCLWKHRSWLSVGQCDWRAVVFYINNSLFSVLFPTISLLVEMSLLLQIFTGRWEGLVLQFILFQTLDVGYAALGAGQWRRRILLLAVLLPAQRIFYRYAYMFLMVKSYAKAFAGTEARWETVRRRGTAQLQFLETNPIVF